MRTHAINIALLLISSPVLADPMDDVRCHEIAFSKAAENQEVDTFRSFIDVDARFVGSVVTRGPDETVAAWQPFFAADGPTIKWRPQFVEVREDGELALTRGPYRMTSKDSDGNTVEHWGTFNSIWRKIADGEWRVIFDAGSSAATPPDEETRSLLEQEDDC
ncbi:MAG: YybH family protein [Woeseiaceae bacterium]